MRNLKKHIFIALSVLTVSAGILVSGNGVSAAEPELPGAAQSGRDYRIALKEAREQGNKGVVHGAAEKAGPNGSVSKDQDSLKGNQAAQENEKDRDTGHLTVRDVYGRDYPYGFRRPGPPPNLAKLKAIRNGERRGYGSGRPGPGMRYGRPGPGMGPGRGPRPGMRPPYGRGPGGPDGPRLRPGSTIGPRDFRRAARSRDRARMPWMRPGHERGHGPHMRGGPRGHFGPPHRR